MKTTFQKTTIALVMFVFAIAVSCNEQPKDITPTFNNSTTLSVAPATDQE